MKTSEQILLRIMQENNAAIDRDEYKWILKAMNEAREDAIKECAERAVAKADYYRGRFTGDSYVDKQSILNILNDLK